MPLEGTSAPTAIESFRPAPRASEATAEIRLPKFFPGDLLAGRYRLASLLGRGGMGEIYQVEDVKLGQAVALKFLPEAVARNGAVLARFHQEVRLARQVSHPNVCRVFDVGEADGRPFLSMELIHGTDLQSLLRREGRLPPNKALDIAWQLCAGLAAIHDAGILHRDLKPSNVMIDGRGRVRITDFGVAALAGEASEEWSGTPAYMAPEQAAHGHVSVESDLYSLGLVLYEMLSGRRAFEDRTSPSGHGSERHGPVSLSRLVLDLDPTIERMILRCLEPDPANRPTSAAEVARVVSGDSLAAALASGELPTPEMVAAAPGVGDLSLAKGAACLLGVLAALFTIVLLSGRFMAHRQVPLPYSTEALAGRARNLLAQLGYREPLRNRAYGFELDPLKPESRPLYWFWYRESPQPLKPVSLQVGPDDPPRTAPGEAYLVLDPEGRLERLEVLPWKEGRAPLRIVGGRKTSSMAVTKSGGDLPPVAAMLVLVVTLVMTRRHLRVGIGDLNGAWRLSTFVFALSLVDWFSAGKGLPLGGDLSLLIGESALAWCLYLSFEPPVRRRWPLRMVAWTRLMAGHVRDPMVGRDLLIGCLLGLAFVLICVVETLISVSAGGQPRFRLAGPESLTGFAGVVRQLCSDLHGAVFASFASVLCLLALQRILGREGRAVGAFAALYVALQISFGSDHPWLALAAGGAKVALDLFIWLRFGLLANIAARLAFLLVLTYPLTDNPSDWYAGTTLFVLLAVGGLAVYGFVVSTAPSIRSR
jgi:predicted Ser/Thr protein kinase